MHIKCPVLLAALCLVVSLAYAQDSERRQWARESVDILCDRAVSGKTVKKIANEPLAKQEKEPKDLGVSKQHLDSSVRSINIAERSKVEDAYEESFWTETLCSRSFTQQVSKELQTFADNTPGRRLLSEKPEKGRQKSSDYRGTACDRVASGDVSRLGAALERLRNERIDMNCETESFPSSVLEWLMGPYYGWAGTNAKCDVRIRIDGDVACGCSSRRSGLNSGDDRHIYRVRLSDGAELPPIIGRCTGRRYGLDGSACFMSSMIMDDCEIAQPEDSMEYEEFLRWMEKLRK